MRSSSAAEAAGASPFAAGVDTDACSMVLDDVVVTGCEVANSSLSRISSFSKETFFNSVLSSSMRSPAL